MNRKHSTVRMCTALAMLALVLAGAGIFGVRASAATYVVKVGQELQTTIQGKWKSSNKKIVSVNKKGLILAKKVGTARVSCTKGGTLYESTIKVKKNNQLITPKSYHMYKNVDTIAKKIAGAKPGKATSFAKLSTSSGQWIFVKRHTHMDGVAVKLINSKRKNGMPSGWYEELGDSWYTLKNYRTRPRDLRLAVTMLAKNDWAKHKEYYQSACAGIISQYGLDQGTELEKIYKIYSYCKWNLVYDYSVSEKAQTMYTAVSENRTVCAGASLLFTYLCDQVGVRSMVYTMYSKTHQCNLVEYNGAWYYVDCTPSTDTPSNLEKAIYERDTFMLGPGTRPISPAPVLSSDGQMHCSYGGLTAADDVTVYNEAGMYRRPRFASAFPLATEDLDISQVPGHAQLQAQADADVSVAVNAGSYTDPTEGSGVQTFIIQSAGRHGTRALLPDPKIGVTRTGIARFDITLPER